MQSSVQRFFDQKFDDPLGDGLSSILIPVVIIAAVRSASHEAMMGRPLSGIVS